MLLYLPLCQSFFFIPMITHPQQKQNNIFHESCALHHSTATKPKKNQSRSFISYFGITDSSVHKRAWEHTSHTHPPLHLLVAPGPVVRTPLSL